MKFYLANVLHGPQIYYKHREKYDHKKKLNFVLFHGSIRIKITYKAKKRILKLIVQISKNHNLS